MTDKLPKGWVKTKLGEICSKPQYGWTTSASQEGRLKLLRTTDITSGTIDWRTVPFCRDEPPDPEKLLLHDGDIVISRAGSVGFSLRISLPPQAVFASYLIRFRPSDEMNGNYVGYFLQSPAYWSQVRLNTAGIAIPNINASKLEQFEFPLAPIREQERIVAKLDALLSRVTASEVATKRALERLTRYRSAVLRSAVTGELTAKWRKTHKSTETGAQLLQRLLHERRVRWEETELKRLESSGKPPKDNNWKKRYPEPTTVQAQDLPTLPSGWVWTSLDQLGELNRGKSKHRPRDDARLYGGPYPFIQTGDVRQSEGTIREHHQTYSEFGLKQSKLWPAGTLCITIAANIAETGILTYPACFPDSIVGFVQDETFLKVRFVEFFIRSEKSKLERYAPATAQKNINLEILKGLAIPLPPLEEQKEIVREAETRLSAADNLAESLNRQLARSLGARQSLMSEAFSGRLLPQDPNDEPASVLLERIRATSEIGAQKPKTTRHKFRARKERRSQNAQELASDESSKQELIVPISLKASRASSGQVRLISLKLYDDFNSLKAAAFPLRSVVRKSERLSPLCLVGLNGSGKSNLIEALSEIFCYAELSLLPWQSITNRQRLTEVRFDLEYQLHSGKAKPVTVRLEKPSSQPVVFKVIRRGKEEVLTNPQQCLALLPTRVLGYSSGLNETISIPYFRTAAIYSQEVLKQARRERLNPYESLPDVNDSNTFFMDYEFNALIFISNYLLQPGRRLNLFREHLRIDSPSGFDIRFRGTYAGKKRVELTRELTGYLNAIRTCANSVERERQSEVFRFTDPKAAAPRLKSAFKTAVNFFRALYKLSLLNALALSGKERKFFLREESRLGQLERPPTISREDRIFSVENIRVNITNPARDIDYAAISDGEHQFLQIFGSVILFDEPGCVFLLDEPETHFNPQWRRLSIQWLADIKSTQRQELMISTHSPFVVSGCHKNHVFKFVREGERSVCSKVGEETFGASYDYLLARLFSLETMVAGEAIEQMRELVKSTSVEKLRQAIPRFGESLEKRFIFERIAQLEQMKKNQKRTK